MHVKQARDSFLTLLAIACVPSRGNKSYSVGLEMRAPQHFIACGRNREGREENLIVSNL